MNALIHFENDEVRQMVNFAVESTFRLRLLDAPTDAAALKILREEPGIDVIISDGLREGSAFFQYIAEHHSDLPCFIYSASDSKVGSLANQINLVGVYSRNELIPQLTKSFIQLFGENIVLEDSKNKYVRIKTDLLLSTGKLESDIFIQLSPKKYLKLFHQGDDFEERDFKKYTVEKDIDYLFVRTDAAHHFINKFKDRVSEVLGDAAEQKYEEGIEKGTEVLELVGELIDTFGFTPEVQQITKTSVTHSIQLMGNDPQLSNVLKAFEGNRHQYIASHSMMLAHVSCAVAASLVWLGEKEFEKLTFSAFLHDVTLKNQELAKLGTKEDLEAVKSQFTKEEIQEFLKHPMKATDLVKAFPDVPIEAQNIIAQHHERPNGTGFPNGLRHNYIKSLSSVFIFSHDLVQYIFDQGENAQLKTFLKKTKSLYQEGAFKKIWQSMVNLALENDPENEPEETPEKA